MSLYEKIKRSRQLLHDRKMLTQQEGIEEETLQDAFREVKDSLYSGDTYFKIQDSNGSTPDSQEGIDSVIITEQDRGYLFIQRDRNDEFVDYGMMRVDYDQDEDTIRAGIAQLIQFDCDELPDPTATPHSKYQFYFDLLEKGGDRAPEELIARLSEDFTPDYDVPEPSDWRYDD